MLLLLLQNQITLEFSLTPQQCICICKFFVLCKKIAYYALIVFYVFGFCLAFIVRICHSQFTVKVDVDERILKLWILFIHSDLRLTFVWVKFVLCMCVCVGMCECTTRVLFRLSVSNFVLLNAFGAKWEIFLLRDIVVVLVVVVFLPLTMSVLSKYFHEAIASATCRDIVHPYTDSCWHAALGYFFKVSYNNWMNYCSANNIFLRH